MAEARVYETWTEFTPRVGTLNLDLSLEGDSGAQARLYDVQAAVSTITATGQINLDLNLTESHIVIGDVTRARLYEVSTFYSGTTITTQGFMSLVIGAAGQVVQVGGPNYARVYGVTFGPSASGNVLARIYDTQVGATSFTPVYARMYDFSVTQGSSGGPVAARIYDFFGRPTTPATAGTNVLVGGAWMSIVANYVLVQGRWVSHTLVTDPTPPDNFVLGTTKPDATTGGVLPGVSRVDYNKTNRLTVLNITTANTTYQDMTFWCLVKVSAANVKFINCWFKGDGTDKVTAATHQVDALVDCRPGTCVTASFERCTMIPDTYQPFWNGIMGHDFTMLRCEVAMTTDGIGVYRTQTQNINLNVYIYGTYVHDLIYWRQGSLADEVTYTVHPSDTQTHNDCLQIQGGWRAVVYGCNFYGFFNTQFGTATGRRPQANSAIQYNSNVGDTALTQVTYNWFDGGGASINGAVKTANIGTIAHNRFGHGQSLQGSGYNDTYTILVASTATYDDLSGNTYEDNGVPVHVRTNG